LIKLVSWVQSREEIVYEPPLHPDSIAPKVLKLIEVLEYFKNNESFCGIVFVERRYIAYTLSAVLSRVSKLKTFIQTDCLVGHGDTKDGAYGMKYKQQNKVINDFREGKLNLLISTSVAEEGLNIQPCMLVIRFDPFNNLLSYIQSRGRARHRTSKYLILIQKGNAAQEYQLCKLRKEEKMMLSKGQETVENMLTGEMNIETDEINEGYNEDDDVMKEGEYYLVNSTCAFVNLHSSISLVYDFCSSLPQDIYCQLLPEFNFSHYESGYKCELKMPPNAPFHSITTEDFYPSKQKAKQSVALEACIRLHKLEQLDDHLRPIKTIAEDEIVEVEDDEDPLMGTRRRRHQYDVHVPAFYDPFILADLVPNSDQIHDLYCTLLLIDTPMPDDTKPRYFGLLTKKPMPSIPCYYVFVKTGTKTPVTPMRYSSTISMSSYRLFRAAKFTVHLFCQIFQKEYKSDKFAYLLVPFLQEPDETCGLQECVDWKIIESFRPIPLNYKDIRPSDFKDKIIVDHSRYKAKYYVEEFCEDMTPLTPIANGNSMSNSGDVVTMKHVYQNVRKVKDEVDENQPLLRVGKIGKVRNLLHPFLDKPDTKEEKAKQRSYYVIPQFCSFYHMNASLFRTAMLLPGVLTRMEAILLAQEFKAKMGIHVDDFVLLEGLTTPVANMEMNYQRLETLGDSFIKLSITMYLYLNFKHKHEGQLSMMRSTLVSNKTLYKKALCVNLPGYVTGVPFARKRFAPPFFSTVNKENDPHGIVRTQIMADKPVADCVESTLGACYVTGGLDAALRCYIGFKMDFGPFKEWDDFRKSIPKYSDEFPDFMLPLMDYESIESLINYQFRDRRYLIEAFTHASAANIVTGCYQRLEFLGDAVLDFIVMRYFFTTYDNLPPGRLTDLKDAAVNNATLAFIAVSFGLHTHIIHSSDALLSAIADFSELLETLDLRSQFWLDFTPPKVIR
jgi:endoribonuclease Dicer